MSGATARERMLYQRPRGTILNIAKTLDCASALAAGTDKLNSPTQTHYTYEILDISLGRRARRAPPPSNFKSCFAITSLSAVQRDRLISRSKRSDMRAPDVDVAAVSDIFIAGPEDVLFVIGQVEHRSAVIAYTEI